MTRQIWLDEHRALLVAEFADHLDAMTVNEIVDRETPYGYQLTKMYILRDSHRDEWDDLHMSTTVLWECDTPRTERPQVEADAAFVVHFVPDEVPFLAYPAGAKILTWSADSGNWPLEEKMALLLAPSYWQQAKIYVVLPQAGGHRERLLAQVRAFARGNKVTEIEWAPLDDDPWRMSEEE